MAVISGVDNRKQKEELTIMDVMVEEFHGNFAYLCFYVSLCI